MQSPLREMENGFRAPTDDGRQDSNGNHKT